MRVCGTGSSRGRREKESHDVGQRQDGNGSEREEGARGWSHVSKIYIGLRVSVRTREHALMLKKKKKK